MRPVAARRTSTVQRAGPARTGPWLRSRSVTFPDLTALSLPARPRAGSMEVPSLLRVELPEVAQPIGSRGRRPSSGAARPQRLVVSARVSPALPGGPRVVPLRRGRAEVVRAVDVEPAVAIRSRVRRNGNSLDVGPSPSCRWPCLSRPVCCLTWTTSACDSRGTRSRSAHAGSLAWICQLRLILDRPAGRRCASQGAPHRNPHRAGPPSSPLT